MKVCLLFSFIWFYLSFFKEGYIFKRIFLFRNVNFSLHTFSGVNWISFRFPSFQKASWILSGFLQWQRVLWYLFQCRKHTHMHIHIYKPFAFFTIHVFSYILFICGPGAAKVCELEEFFFAWVLFLFFFASFLLRRPFMIIARFFIGYLVKILPLSNICMYVHKIMSIFMWNIKYLTLRNLANTKKMEQWR